MDKQENTILPPPEAFLLCIVYDILDKSHLCHHCGTVFHIIHMPMSCKCTPDGDNNTPHPNGKELGAEDNRDNEP